MLKQNREPLELCKHDVKYIIISPFGKFWAKIDKQASLSKAKIGGKVKKLEEFTRWPIFLKAKGYKGEFDDAYESVLKLVPPSLLEKSYGFSLKVENSFEDLPNEIEATVVLYNKKGNKNKTTKNKTTEIVFREFGC